VTRTSTPRSSTPRTSTTAGSNATGGAGTAPSRRPARSSKTPGTGRPVAGTLAVAGYVVMIVPILFVVATAFTGGRTLTFPPQGFSLQWFEKAVTYAPFTGALVSSLQLAVLATVIALAVGVPVTLAIHRGRLPGKGLIEGMFLSPLIVPELVVGLALYQQLMIGFGLANFPTLLIGHTALMMPYAVRVTGASLALADPSLEEAARGLGASPVRAFFTVTLPLLRPGIFSAALLSFVTSFNNVPLSLLLQSRDFRTLPVTMLDYVQQSYDPMVAAMATLILAATVVVAVVAERTVGFAKIFGGINK
jgi:putative spermidine/putrescine transport system permease protein